MRTIELHFGEILIGFPANDVALSRFSAKLIAVDAAGGARTEMRAVESRMQRLDGDWRFTALDFSFP
jgi:hypothetical protein